MDLVPRWKLWTAQEHRTIGSSVGIEDYKKNPYTPLAIIDGEISVEECNQLRYNQRTINANPAFWGKPFVEGRQRLESLDLAPLSETYGQTRRDNALVSVSSSLPPSTALIYEFPFKREPTPRVELEDT